MRGQPHAPTALYPGKIPVPIVQQIGWVPEPEWTHEENLAPHRDSIPGPSNPQPVAIPTREPDPQITKASRSIFFAGIMTAYFKTQKKKTCGRNAESDRNKYI